MDCNGLALSASTAVLSAYARVINGCEDIDVTEARRHRCKQRQFVHDGILFLFLL